MEISQSKLKGFLAFMVKNNMSGVQDALKSLGYTPASTAKDLITQLLSIYSNEGTNRLEQIFAKVPIIQSKTSNVELAAIRETLSGEKIDATTAKFSLNDFLAIWAGSTVSSQTDPTTTSTPVVKTGAVIAIVVVAIVSIFFIYKYT